MQQGCSPWANSHGVAAIRELNQAETARHRSFRCQLGQLQTELREINNTLRVSAGGLPQLYLAQSSRCGQRLDQDYHSDCDSVQSGCSASSVKYIATSRHVQAQQLVDRNVGHSLAVNRHADTRGARNKTLTRDNSDVFTLYDNEGYVLPDNQLQSR